ncbi:MAG: hypothetical protein OZSIB_1759 [Candidatus Ozemobacter sibiricus]|uniref:Radical SAM core domain-containing protein n=1 Tax=Candidatus Ozemobacter sibiricus TaxID=2268124 RepID=A0A367ZJA0_9BACT|nr:MAG: hypothetical protein OZSIB_1759 [Candidatus Ozemobacter sibiricus]
MTPPSRPARRPDERPPCPAPGDRLALYIHVPFCAGKCAYCGFYSVPATPEAIDRYLDRLDREAHERITPELAARLRTVFIGGGNPTALGAAALGRLLHTLTDILGGSPIEEWTIETNPETFRRELRPLLRPLPGLRLSIGLQRLRDEEIAWLGRSATARQGRQAIETALTITPNVGIDLILGVPELPSLAPELRSLVESLPIRHVSAYFLTLEPDTPYAEAVAAGSRQDPAETGPEELFGVAAVLQAAGFEQYEISNFARAGSRCQHNLAYWHQHEYLGLGPAAVGTLAGQRRTNPPSLPDWLADVPPTFESLDESTRQREFLLLRLRLLQEGLDLQEWERRFGPPAPTLIAALDREVAAGLLSQAGLRYRLTPAGLPFANQVIARLF